MQGRRRRGGRGGPDPRTFENRAVRPPPDSRMNWPKSVVDFYGILGGTTLDDSTPLLKNPWRRPWVGASSSICPGCNKAAGEDY